MLTKTWSRACGLTVIIFFIGFQAFIPASAQVTFNVTVVDKTSEHPAFGEGWPEGYAIDGVQGATLTLQRGTTYVFQMQSVPGLHPFYISTSATGGGSGAYSDGVQGNFATGNATLTFTPSANAPDLLYYQCSSHAGMGWRINIAGAVSSQPGAELPATMSLEQNYPNPFNPSTVIRFQIPASTHVSLTVFDAQGRSVATLIDAPLAAGAHAVEWNATDMTGAPVPSGTYFYRLARGMDSVMRAMTLIR